jgi:Mn-containing catalase
MDIGTEELSHLEIVGCLARMHLKPMKSVREAAEADPLVVNLFNSMGNPWTADYLKITGELDVDLCSNDVDLRSNIRAAVPRCLSSRQKL